jgi:hypothetical protein
MQIRSALFIAFAFVVPSVAAHAGSAAQVTLFKGTQAATSFNIGPNAVCADGSIGTASGFGFLSGSNSVSRQPGSGKSSSNGTSIDIFGYSTSCNSDSIGFGEAGISGGYNGPNPQLMSATISGTTTVQDFDSSQSYPLTVNLKFTGQGPISSSKGTSVTHDSGNGYSVIVSRGAFKSRDAGVTGTITIDGVELDASFSATSLVSNSSGQVVVQKKN